MGYPGREDYSRQGVRLYRGVTPEFHLKYIHLADEDICLKFIGVGQLDGYRACKYFITAGHVDQGDETVKRCHYFRAFAPRVRHVFAGIFQSFLGILQVTLSQRKTQLLQRHVLGDIGKVFLSGSQR